MKATVNPSQLDTTDLHRCLGATPCDEGVSFCVWSPTARRVRIQFENDRSLELGKTEGGYHIGIDRDSKVGDAYRISVDDGPWLPDPASRCQRESVHGASVVVDPAFKWHDQDWCPPEIEDWIVYELHVGTWTDEGTFLSAIDRLDELVELGIRAIELMPVADCAGRWNWGYDGVHLFAPNRNYGSPDDLRRLIDAAHQRGLAVILDVVYNHLGPEGNYLGAMGPYLSTKHETVWGSPPNLDDPDWGDQCRRFFIANAIYWFDEFHFDGLRVDAIHCIEDDRRPHFASELADVANRYQSQSGRRVFLIAESNVYDPNMVLPTDQGGVGFDAQWSDDFVHSLMACLRPADQLSDRVYQPTDDLRQTIDRGYVYRGTFDEFRRREDAPAAIETRRLVRCIQNHDFIGNHPTGQRLTSLTDPATHASAAALMMLMPSIPMLFMGEEFACENPFSFFVDFGDEHLRRNVIEGRKREYPQHDWSDGVLPTDRQAMSSSRIGPITDHRMWRWYQTLIRLRSTLDLGSGAIDGTVGALLPPTHPMRFDLRRRDHHLSVGLRRFGDEPMAAPSPPASRELDVLLDSREHFDWHEGSSWVIVHRV